jgi:hypothetical protein
MSPRRNRDSPTPSLASECAPHPGTNGGGDTRLRVRGWGSPNSDDWRKSLALCLLCDPDLENVASKKTPLKQPCCRGWRRSPRLENLPTGYDVRFPSRPRRRLPPLHQQRGRRGGGGAGGRRTAAEPPLGGGHAAVPQPGRRRRTVSAPVAELSRLAVQPQLSGLPPLKRVFFFPGKKSLDIQRAPILRRRR